MTRDPLESFFTAVLFASFANPLRPLRPAVRISRSRPRHSQRAHPVHHLAHQRVGGFAQGQRAAGRVGRGGRTALGEAALAQQAVAAVVRRQRGDVGAHQAVALAGAVEAVERRKGELC